MNLSKFEKLALKAPRPTHEGKGNPQRSNIPRTTQVKRLRKSDKSPLSLKAYARGSDMPIVVAWLKAK